MHISTHVSPKAAQPDTLSVSEKSERQRSQTSSTPTLSPRGDSPQKKNLLGLADALAGIESTVGHQLLDHPEIESLCKVRRSLSELMQDLWSLPVNSAAFKQTSAAAKDNFIELMFRADYLTLNHERHGISKTCAEELNGVMMQVRDKFRMIFGLQLAVLSEKDNRIIANLCTQPLPVQLSHSRPQLLSTKRHGNLEEMGSLSPRRKNASTVDTADAIVPPTSPRVLKSVPALKTNNDDSLSKANLTTSLSPSTAETAKARKD